MAPRCSEGTVSDVSASTSPSGTSPTRRLANPIFTLATAGLAWAALTAWQPGDNGPILCPWRAITGVDCPFCGTTRAAAALGRGDFVAALDHNALAVLILLPAATAAWGLWTVRASKGRRLPTLSNRAMFGGLIVVVLWWILRLLVPWLGSSTSY